MTAQAQAPAGELERDAQSREAECDGCERQQNLDSRRRSSFFVRPGGEAALQRSGPATRCWGFGRFSGRAVAPPPWRSRFGAIRLRLMLIRRSSRIDADAEWPVEQVRPFLKQG